MATAWELLDRELSAISSIKEGQRRQQKQGYIELLVLGGMSLHPSGWKGYEI
jgi:hypothetical protein